MYWDSIPLRATNIRYPLEILDPSGDGESILLWHKRLFNDKSVENKLHSEYERD